MKIPIKMIKADEDFNCRGHITMESVKELAESLSAQGLIQPIVVTQEAPYQWKCVAGHRRLAAATLLGWEAIEAIEHASLSPEEAHKINLQENMARKDLTPSQEMRAILAIYGNVPDRALVAKELGRSKKWVNDRMKLRTLEDRILDKVDSKELGALDLQYICATVKHEQWNLAQRLMANRKAGVAAKTTARRLNLRKKAQNRRQITRAIEALSNRGVTPNWHRAMQWCAGDISTEDFFGCPVDDLFEYGIM